MGCDSLVRNGRTWTRRVLANVRVISAESLGGF